MNAQRLILIGSILLAVGYAWLSGAFVGWPLIDPAAGGQTPSRQADPRLQKATFAAGCFWSVEADFDQVKGVVETTSGYTGGRIPNPTYEQVARGATDHAEAVEILFDPAVVTYEQLLQYYWRHVDPFSAQRQFCDAGAHYRPEIFVHSPAQRAAAEASRARVQTRFNLLVVVPITDAGPFYRAEPYHQGYHRTHAIQYRYYRWRCGRDARLDEIWRQQS